MPFIAAALVGGISSIFGGISQSNAADTAANQEEQGQQQVLNLLGGTQPQETGAISSGVAGANSTLSDTYNQNLGLLAPYLTSGTNALAQLNGLTAAGGFQAPTAAEAAATPGEQFTLQQGELAQQRSAAAAGNVLGGGEAKALQQYSQGLASTGYQNAYNNALQGYQTNFGNLSTLAGLGANATNTGVSSGNILGSQSASGTLQGGLSTAGVLGQNFGNAASAISGSANAAAQGTVGSANALSNGVTQGTSGLSNLLLLQQLLGSGGGSSFGNTSLNGVNSGLNSNLTSASQYQAPLNSSYPY